MELYVSFPKVPGAPLRALRGCQRIHVDAGKLQHVKLTLQPRDLSYVNEAGNRMVGAGDYVITTGGDNQAPERRTPMRSLSSAENKSCRSKMTAVAWVTLRT